MSDTSKISVIIPTYNRAGFLLETISSVLDQSHQVHEVLICDDGSTDGSETIVKGFEQDKVHWVPCGRNGRPAIPRNIGMRKATGDWIAFLDSDDTWHPNKIKTQLEYAETYNYKAVCANAVIKRESNAKTYFQEEFGELGFESLLECNRVVCSSVLFDKSIYEEMGGFPEDQSYTAIEDYLYWLRISSKYTFGFCSEPLVTYLDLPKSSIRNYWTDVDLQRKTIDQYILEQFQDPNTKDIVDRYLKKRNGQGIDQLATNRELWDFGRKIKRLLKRLFGNR